MRSAGTFFQPTVIADATTSMLFASEETFGPVAPLFRFKTEADAIALANATEFGLAAYMYSRDIGRCLRVAEAIEAGIVGINTGLISNEVAPFGGVKQSGIGREGLQVRDRRLRRDQVPLRRRGLIAVYRVRAPGVRLADC
jgi:succinate-semialdehyde dehydrogenase/glutarate-semialdehyde dehydrogenase